MLPKVSLLRVCTLWTRVAQAEPFPASGPRVRWAVGEEHGA